MLCKKTENDARGFPGDHGRDHPMRGTVGLYPTVIRSICRIKALKMRSATVAPCAISLGVAFFEAINRVMAEPGHVMRGGTIVDAARPGMRKQRCHAIPPPGSKGRACAAPPVSGITNHTNGESTAFHNLVDAFRRKADDRDDKDSFQNSWHPHATRCHSLCGLCPWASGGELSVEQCRDLCPVCRISHRRIHSSGCPI